ncbi:MAG: Tetratricopeptide repeat-containing protein [Candidatus Kentron sp. G]|nr:MAG: Tetratricopeptide repeat-containing protein [Candidatus Kentron sp. G]VFM97771.1 MAG: Tetratricopeptide repeat-containing protein [Candidatus Kentron sp. G]VFM97926.1 MAG: Tetratricopeptide repeat-containing protein [Candidatus Kentron sp. G]
MSAKGLGLHELQLEWTQRAITENPEDGWAWAQYGDALLLNNQLEQALQAYRETAAFGNYEDNVVAKTGRAEVLKAMGHFDEALNAYQDVMAGHPENVVAKTGRAEVLKAMGRLDEALNAYEDAMAGHPENVVAKTGRAEVFKAMGRLDEALNAYEDVIAGRPEDVVAKTGCAGVFFLLGEYEQALRLLPQRQPTTQEEWIGWHVRGMIYLDRGDLAQATRDLQLGVEQCPLPSQRDYFRSALALAKTRIGDWAGAREQVDRITNPLLEEKTNVIRFRIYAHNGDRAGMERTVKALETKQTSVCIELTAELRRRFLDKKPGDHSERWLEQKTVHCLAA